MWLGANKKFKAIPKLVKIKQYNEKMEKALQDKKKIAKKQKKIINKMALLDAMLLVTPARTELTPKSKVSKTKNVEEKEKVEEEDKETTPKASKVAATPKILKKSAPKVPLREVADTEAPKVASRAASISLVTTPKRKLENVDVIIDSTPSKKAAAIASKQIKTDRVTSITPKRITTTPKKVTPQLSTKRSRNTPAKYSPKSPLYSSTPKKTPKRR